jgi:CubicO group peptidase (beta-lactamase class C family)
MRTRKCADPKTLAVFLLLFFNAASCAFPQGTGDPLPRSTPEAEGVSSAGILRFISAAEGGSQELHSFMFLRHGKVIAEGWWKPYGPGLRNTIYSLSKSFTSTAVGFAVSENRLTLNDNVISFFPEYLPDSISPFLSEMRVKDLLTMSTGQFPEPTWTIIYKDTNWVKAFLAFPVVNEPGTRFMYNSAATYMLSAIITKVTGQNVVDYLTPRLFTPLGIEGMDWETDPMGINTGGWGLRVRTEDIARFGQFCLQKGRWNGRQLLPASWFDEATTAKIEQEPEALQSKKDSSDWLQGYCYQFWRCRNNAFRGDGAYGQFMVVMPDQDAVVVITSESSDLQGELNLVWKYLLPAIHVNSLPGNDSLSAALKQKLATLALPLPVNAGEPTFARTISNLDFRIRPNKNQINITRFEFTNDVCKMTLLVGKTQYEFSFGEGSWITGVTDRQGPDLFYGALSHLAGLGPFKVAGSYGWKDPRTLVLELIYTESPHRETFTCRFMGKKLRMEILSSNNPEKGKTILKGKSLRISPS